MTDQDTARALYRNLRCHCMDLKKMAEADIADIAAALRAERDRQREHDAQIAERHQGIHGEFVAKAIRQQATEEGV